MTFSFDTKKFSELSNRQLYNILQLRSEIFVVEQDCPYQDLDNKDEIALHLFMEENDQVVAYTRLFDKGEYFDMPSIGRVATKMSHRGKGLGRELMKISIKAVYDIYGPQPIKIAAQMYLQDFYKSLGFENEGEEFRE